MWSDIGQILGNLCSELSQIHQFSYNFWDNFWKFPEFLIISGNFVAFQSHVCTKCRHEISSGNSWFQEIYAMNFHKFFNLVPATLGCFHLIGIPPLRNPHPRRFCGTIRPLDQFLKLGPQFQSQFKRSKGFLYLPQSKKEKRLQKRDSFKSVVDTSSFKSICLHNVIRKRLFLDIQMSAGYAVI